VGLSHVTSWYATNTHHNSNCYSINIKIKIITIMSTKRRAPDSTSRPDSPAKRRHKDQILRFIAFDMEKDLWDGIPLKTIVTGLKQRVLDRFGARRVCEHQRLVQEQISLLWNLLHPKETEFGPSEPVTDDQPDYFDEDAPDYIAEEEQERTSTQSPAELLQELLRDE
jgi:hypothetical protein